MLRSSVQASSVAVASCFAVCIVIPMSTIARSITALPLQTKFDVKIPSLLDKRSRRSEQDSGTHLSCINGVIAIDLLRPRRKSRALCARDITMMLVVLRTEYELSATCHRPRVWPKDRRRRRPPLPYCPLLCNPLSLHRWLNLPSDSFVLCRCEVHAGLFLPLFCIQCWTSSRCLAIVRRLLTRHLHQCWWSRWARMNYSLVLTDSTICRCSPAY